MTAERKQRSGSDGEGLSAPLLTSGLERAHAGGAKPGSDAAPPPPAVASSLRQRWTRGSQRKARPPSVRVEGVRGGVATNPTLSLWSFLGHMLLVGVDETVTAEMEEASARERRRGVYHFLSVPYQLEQLLLLGYLVCLDSFLFMVTMLPVRVLMALLGAPFTRRLSWLQVCDVMCVGAIVLTVLALNQIDTSQAYHSVKGQAVIKLYVVFNVLEVFDKLCASFGQDILHTLFWSSMARRRWRGNLLLDFVIVVCYLVVHALVLFYQVRRVACGGRRGGGEGVCARAVAGWRGGRVRGSGRGAQPRRAAPLAPPLTAGSAGQVVSLNVAVNSHNNVMLTLLVSNNFVELKSNVFKRFEPENLFQVACADMVERFQLTVFLVCVSLHVLSVHGSHAADYAILSNVGGAVVMVAAAELLVDWIKHAFVIKFNSLLPTVYRRFHYVLCRDLANSIAGGHEERQAGPHMLQSGAAASTRIGFSCIPLLCLAVRSVTAFIGWLGLHRSPSGLCVLALGWVLLFALKVLCSVALTGYACARIVEGGRVPHSPHVGPAAADAASVPPLDGGGHRGASAGGGDGACAGGAPSAANCRHSPHGSRGNSLTLPPAALDGGLAGSGGGSAATAAAQAGRPGGAHAPSGPRSPGRKPASPAAGARGAPAARGRSAFERAVEGEASALRACCPFSELSSPTSSCGELAPVERPRRSSDGPGSAGARGAARAPRFGRDSGGRRSTASDDVDGVEDSLIAHNVSQFSPARLEDASRLNLASGCIPSMDSTADL